MQRPRKLADRLSHERDIPRELILQCSTLFELSLHCFGRVERLEFQALRNRSQNVRFAGSVRMDFKKEWTQAAIFQSA